MYYHNYFEKYILLYNNNTFLSISYFFYFYQTFIIFIHGESSWTLFAWEILMKRWDAGGVTLEMKFICSCPLIVRHWKHHKHCVFSMCTVIDTTAAHSLWDGQNMLLSLVVFFSLLYSQTLVHIVIWINVQLFYIYSFKMFQFLCHSSQYSTFYLYDSVSWES